MIFHRITLLLPLVTCPLLGFTAPHGRPAANTEGHPSVSLRVQTFAREQEIVTNPIRWSQFTFRAPEGSRIQKGEPLFEFDLSIPQDRMRSIEKRLAENRLQVEILLQNIREQIIGLQDEKERLRDQFAVREARLNHLKSLPREEDVAIARGRLDVAQRNLEAARSERDTMKTRLENDWVAPAALEQAETTLRRQQARTDYARNRFHSAQASPPPADLRIVELQMANLQLEIGKLQDEIASQQEILRIETRSAERRIEEILNDQQEVEEELRHAQVLAPRSGVVLYTSRLKRELASGGKPPRGVALAEIPEPDSLALRGRLPEDIRSIFRPGDPAEVTLNPLPNQTFPAVIHSISPLPRDLADVDRRTGDGDEETGVKVYDVVITLRDLPDNIPFGVYGTAEIRTAEPVRGPSVPLSWIRMRDGDPQLSIHGVFTPVNGISVDDRFILANDHIDISSLSPDGTWPAREAEDTLLDSDRFNTGGQLVPLESISITVPPVRAWDIRVGRLHPEDTFVEKGEVLVELDSERVNNQLSSTEADLTRRIGVRESAEEELAQRRRDGEFQLARARNLLEIRQLEAKLAEDAVQASQLHQTLRDEETARADLEAAQRELQRARRSPELTAPPETRRREREVKRRELQLEQASLQRQQVEKGAGPVERSTAQLAVTHQEAELARLEASTHRSIGRAESTLRRRIRQERSRRERLDRLQEAQNSLTVTAPSSGLVKYENLWDGVGTSKLRSGMGVGSRSHIMSLSDSTSMVVQVAVPERHIPRLRTGLEVHARIPGAGSRLWTGEVQRIAEVLEPAEIPSLRANPYSNLEPPLEHVVNVDILLHDTEQADLKPGAFTRVIFPFSL